MIIQNIIELPNGRRRIITDETDPFCLYKGELAKLNIGIGDELDMSDYEKIMNEILPKRAKLRGLNLLAKRPYTEYQLRKKYEDGGYPNKVIDEAVEYIKGLRLIDDYEYCRTYLTYKSGSRSKRRLYNDLQQKGVANDVIDRAYNNLAENGDLTDEYTVIEKLLVKKHYNSEEASFEERQKMMSFLYGKGFSMEAIRHLT